MPLFDMTKVRDDVPMPSDALAEVRRTTFADQGIQERSHLQAALRDHIELLGPDLMVIGEEFGDFEGANRRIDLLCLGRDARLVVVELKRTADGGHMELQALRYAAMVSTMTFDQVVRTLARYRSLRGLSDHSEETAESDLVEWLESDSDANPAIAREVGIVLASENFSQEITTTVLWLNEFHGFDIRCVRLSPYELGERLLLDVQQVIPLPEASSYTVRVREKEVAARQAKGIGTSDTTKFIVRTPTSTTEPLPKRWAILRLVTGLVEAGVPMDAVRAVLPASKTVKVRGVYASPEDLWQAMQAQLGKPDPKRWHLDDPIVIDGDSWVLHSNWGKGTRGFFQDLLALAPSRTAFDVYEEDAVPGALDDTE
ncbi:hypothetical protein AB0N29_01760 [Nocardioides sp. NPDC092400]|uniref:hypothetical protein n=1 Tax=Nocardioides sp. NPDC092400 TaxID=3155196 RepID=UPI003420487E